MRERSKYTARKSLDDLVMIDTADPAFRRPYEAETAEENEERMRRVDRHVITREEYEEIPEMTREMAEAGDLYIGGKLIRRGRPPKPKKKVAISIRLSEDVLEAFKFCGPGWQTRIDEALAQWLEEHPAVEPTPAPVTAPAPSGRAGSKRSSPRRRQAP